MFWKSTGTGRFSKRRGVNSPPMQTPIENDYLRLWLEEDILCAYFKQENLDITAARKAVQLRMDHFNDRSYLFLIDISMTKHMTDEAKQFLASSQATRYIWAGAFLGMSYISCVIGNLFLYVFKPTIPSKLFTDREEARLWLLQHK